ncbi:MAG: hypothetical protein GX242_05345 [Clostridiales bacterium]|jgi:hypothetical protein|nr:hypothetical protein [Clostridiales bacterium]
MARKSKREKRRLEQEYRQDFGQGYGYQNSPHAFYGPVQGLIPVAPPARQPIQLAPIIQPIALSPYGQGQQQPPQQEQSSYDDDDYDF